MTNDTPQPDIAKIHDLLLAAFTPEDLRRFCRDRPTFRPVTKRFGRPYRLDDMADELIAYCEINLLLPELLAELKQHNPRQYARFFEPDLPTPEVEKPREEQPGPAGPIVTGPVVTGDQSIAAGRDVIQAGPGATVIVGAEPAPPTPDEPELEKPREEEPATPTPEIVTITSPFPLDLVRIRAGKFQMGTVMARDKHAEENELPWRDVDVTEFHIGRYPVTNLQYAAFVQATGHQAPRHWEEGRIPGGKQNHPVVNVSWRDAIAFCDWLSRETGQPFRLPTEAEWEKAARGADGQIYPWGDEPPDEDLCNFNNNVGDTTTIGRYSPQGDSPYGCAGMAGNVYEWCQSLYRRYYDRRVDDGQEDLQALGLTRDFRVNRGGSFSSVAALVRCASRHQNNAGHRDADLGFRVARGPLG